MDSRMDLRFLLSTKAEEGRGEEGTEKEGSTFLRRSAWAFLVDIKDFFVALRERDGILLQFLIQ